MDKTILNFDGVGKLFWDSLSSSRTGFEYYEIETFFEFGKCWFVAYHCFINHIIVPGGTYRVRPFYGIYYGEYESIKSEEILV